MQHAKLFSLLMRTPVLLSNVRDTFSLMNNDPNFVKYILGNQLHSFNLLISSCSRDFLTEQPFLRQSDLMTILQVHVRLSEANKIEMSIKICMDLAPSIQGVL